MSWIGICIESRKDYMTRFKLTFIFDEAFETLLFLNLSHRRDYSLLPAPTHNITLTNIVIYFNFILFI